MATRQIAFYGHKGVGTTTVVVNVAAALAEAGQRVIPRSLVVYRCEFFGETLIDAAPLAHHTYLYRKLAKILLAGLPELNPVPLSIEEFEDWGRNWGDRLYELGEGIIEIGSGI